MEKADEGERSGSGSAATTTRDWRAAKERNGLKRIEVWVRPEDVAALREAARSPHALSRLRKKVRAEVRAELDVEAMRVLRRKARRDVLRQIRRDVQRVAAGSNAMPMFVKVTPPPPPVVVRLMRRSRMTFDPVRAIWSVPHDLDAQAAAVQIVGELDRFGCNVELVVG